VNAVTALPSIESPSRELVAPTPAGLLQMAISQGADLDRLERLMALQERWEATEARKAFTVAMTAFKAEPLEIFKKKEVAFLDVRYKHAELSDVTDVVVPAMSRHQLSHRWAVRQDGDRITVDCVVTHIAGHSETVTMEAKPDTSGKKNPIQAIASTVQYLQRYTLLAATGMSTKGQDDDGKGGDDALSDADEAALDDLRAASVDGEVALQAAFQNSPISDDGWKRERGSLIAAAKKADAEAKAKGGRQ
jgi:hypothetical protein